MYFISTGLEFCVWCYIDHSHLDQDLLLFISRFSYNLLHNYLLKSNYIFVCYSFHVSSMLGSLVSQTTHLFSKRFTRAFIVPSSQHHYCLSVCACFLSTVVYGSSGNDLFYHALNFHWFLLLALLSFGCYACLVLTELRSCIDLMVDWPWYLLSQLSQLLLFISH